MVRASMGPCRHPGTLVAVVLVLGCGGKPTTPAEQPLCRISTSIAGNKPLADRTMPAPFWFTLLVRGYISSGAIARPVRDCEGQLVSWPADA